jgi:hypothetical protein
MKYKCGHSDDSIASSSELCKDCERGKDISEILGRKEYSIDVTESTRQHMESLVDVMTVPISQEEIQPVIQTAMKRAGIKTLYLDSSYWNLEYHEKEKGWQRIVISGFAKIEK